MQKRGILLREEVGHKAVVPKMTKKDMKVGGNKHGIQKKEKQFKKR